MRELREFAVVRVKQLLREGSHYDGWNVNRRKPEVGDVGTIVEVLHAPSLPTVYVVESSDGEGITVWLGDFTAEEFECVD